MDLTPTLKALSLAYESLVPGILKRLPKQLLDTRDLKIWCLMVNRRFLVKSFYIAFIMRPKLTIRWLNRLEKYLVLTKLIFSVGLPKAIISFL